MTLLEKLAAYLNCTVVQLNDRLNHPIYRLKALNYLTDKRIMTTYGTSKRIKCHGFSHFDSTRTMAYEGYLNVTIQQHFYIKHRIRLENPYIKCLMYRSGISHFKYYPLELLDIEESESMEFKTSSLNYTPNSTPYNSECNSPTHFFPNTIFPAK